jgi:hypothetical protein
MAVYWNLAIDCGANETVATQIAQHFRQSRVIIEPHAPVELSVGIANERDKYFISIWPVGMGAGIPPGYGSTRPELLSEDMIARVGDHLLGQLATQTGFRRAMFGAERFDTFVHATAEEDDDIDYSGMIFSTQHFPTIPRNLTTSEFAKGYCKVVARH